MTAASEHAEDTECANEATKHVRTLARTFGAVLRRAGINPGNLRDDVHASEPSKHDEVSRCVQKNLNNKLEHEHERSEQDGKENSPHRAPEDPDGTYSNAECIRNI